MYKFRTMHVAHAHGTSPITADHDPRIFPFGNFLRKTKIDELPQLVNILIGQMAIIGPRAEDPAIVAAHYDTAARETLRVLPGLSSPGSLYYFTHCEDMLTGDDPERLYLEQVLPLKLALDRIYVQQSGPLQNFRMIGRTVVTILQVLCGQKNFPDPPEMAQARELLGVELPTPEW
jgi:lipopolysaccharide/colanic/teichoic acid biosynthesis glycosyltransferase